MSLPEGYVLARFGETNREAVISLWQVCDLTRPWNDPDKDIDRKLTDTQGRFLLVLHEGNVVASVMVGYDGHRGSVYYLAVHPEHQKSGLGRSLMQICEVFLKEQGCPKINLMVRRTNVDVVAFYDQLGYAEDEVVVLGKRLIADADEAGDA